ncbi:hypothetical protein HELRODRAFT_102250 [Helobdella robusta]|uniref:VPS37 C-terminal domain-containing protein n=1 Tax=Helobdella robusta TaxID=6412 RepID=T1ED89_HELRO|nr:hypothetical protein HELRODRAFT_102250 [Helobdella robusta]ESN97016.1 hypothetical protein HELRODRAFT_102250 [Helobdella robusta]
MMTNQASLESSFSFLTQLTADELESLENDWERIKKLVDDSDVIKKQQMEKENLSASIKSLAEYNLSLEPKLNQAKVQLAQTHEQAVETFKSYDKNRLLMEGTPSKTQPDVQLALLQAETAKSEEECEKLVDNLMNKTVDVDTFITDYLTTRTLSHIRRIKCDKMTELLRQQQRRRESAPLPKTSNVQHEQYSAYSPTHPLNYSSRPMQSSYPNPMPSSSNYYPGPTSLIGYNNQVPGYMPAAGPPYPINNFAQPPPIASAIFSPGAPSYPQSSLY